MRKNLIYSKIYLFVLIKKIGKEILLGDSLYPRLLVLFIDPSSRKSKTYSKIYLKAFDDNFKTYDQPFIDDLKLLFKDQEVLKNKLIVMNKFFSTIVILMNLYKCVTNCGAFKYKAVLCSWPRI